MFRPSIIYEFFGRGLEAEWAFQNDLLSRFREGLWNIWQKQTITPEFRNFLGGWLNHAFKDSTSYPPNNQKTWSPERNGVIENSKFFQFHLETAEFVYEAISFGRPPRKKNTGH